MSLTLGSLFDGIGVFPLAASRHGIIPVWASTDFHYEKAFSRYAPLGGYYEAERL